PARSPICWPRRASPTTSAPIAMPRPACVSGPAPPSRPRTSKPSSPGWTGPGRSFRSDKIHHRVHREEYDHRCVRRRSICGYACSSASHVLCELCGGTFLVCSVEAPMPKVLIADDLSHHAVAIFRQRGVEVDVRTGLKPPELMAAVAGYDGLAVRSATKVTAEVLAAAPKLKVVGRAGIGVDNIDVAAATQRGVVVMNTPHGNSITTAEHAIAMMFALARQIPQADKST